MTIKELENYILDKADTNKTMIAKWNYIRYTVIIVCLRRSNVAKRV